jgi:hypothetical protein
VDETGQDTKGRLFVVAVVVTDAHRDELSLLLESIEASSGKKKRKWLKTRPKERKLYIEGLIAKGFPAHVYACVYSDGGAYEALEVLATAQSITLYRAAHGIGDDYKVTVAIDGLSKNLATRVGSSLRKLGIKTRNVHGERDESSALIRLADSVAGLVREAQEGREECRLMEKRLKGRGVLIRLN